MDTGVQTASSVRETDGLRARIVEWVFLEGDRRLLAAGIVVGVVLVIGSLVGADVVTVGPDSSVATVAASGLTAGVVTLLTIALSINQLILSRVFGSPDRLTDRLDGTRALRGRVEELAGRPASPNDPGAFLSLLGATVSDHATAALSAIEEGDGDPPVAVIDALDDIAAYGRSIDEHVQAGTSVNSVLGVIVGPEYARNMVAVGRLRDEYGESLPADANCELRDLGELLEVVAVVRQFFKTISLQQDFATLSRLLIYSGLVALVVSVSLSLVYRTGAVTVPRSVLPVVVTLGLGVVFTPLALFATYILRASTIAYRTVSVGPFVPPGER